MPAIASLLSMGSGGEQEPKEPPSFHSGDRGRRSKAIAERSLLELGQPRKVTILYGADEEPAVWIDQYGAKHEWSYVNGISDEPLAPDPFSVRYGASGETSTDYISKHVSLITPQVYENGLPIVWPWEQRQPQSSAPYRHDAMISSALDAASADGKRGRSKTGVKKWFKFTKDDMQTPSARPMDPSLAPLWALLEEERLAMRYICKLVEEDGVAVETAATYFSQVQGWHGREYGVKLAGGLKLTRLPEMIKGLKRQRPSGPRKVRRGFDPKRLRAALDSLLDPRIPLHANLRAAISSAVQGLLRSREYSINAGEKWSAANDIARSDLVSLSRERAILMMRPCKNMHYLSGKTCPLILGGGADFIDAPAELINLSKVDPIDRRLAANTPLFRNPETGKALRTDEILHWTKRIALQMGENPNEFGTHSYRITGATALFAAGATETVIRTLGRWSSDLYRLYVRACFEQSILWSRKAGSTVVSDIATVFDEVDDY